MATERMWGVMARLPSDEIKDKASWRTESKPQTGKQLHTAAVTADRSTLRHPPQQSQELCQDRAWAHRLRWKNQTPCWFSFLWKTTYYRGQPNNWDSQQERSINTCTADAKIMEMCSDDPFPTRKGLFGKSASAWQEGTSPCPRNQQNSLRRLRTQ